VASREPPPAALSGLEEAPHPPEARLHKWEARKDLGVVSAWIARHSAASDLVVDPFMGSGTAPLAAARLGRRAIGIDLSPLAVAIARLTAAPPDPSAVEDGLARLRARLRGPGARTLTAPGFRGTLRDMYAAACPACDLPGELAHAVWSVRRRCACGAVSAATELSAGGRGRATPRTCPACGDPLPRAGGHEGEQLLRLFVRCAACGLVEGPPRPADVELALALERGRSGADVWTPSGVELRYPGAAPFAQLRHALRERPLLDELWTGRNFLATGLLLEAIDTLPAATGQALRLSLSAIVKATSRMPTVNTGGWRHKGTGLSSHLLGVFPLHLEQNAWEELERHATRRLLPGLAAARRHPPVRLVDEPLAPGDLALRQGDAAAELSALPEGSAALAFADPPYGDAIQYAELALPHLAWLARPRSGAALHAHLRELLASAAAAEVVENRAQGKGRAEFLARLGAVMGGLRRVVRPGGAVIVTFNSPQAELVREVVAVAAGAGLRAEGEVLQPAFKDSHKGAWHASTARGTLYLRFAR
jgi:hypothetical protein